MRARYMIFSLLVSFVAVFFAGCFNPTAESDEPAAGPKVLVVRIAGEAPANRTALPPTPDPDQYAISVKRGTGTTLGSETFAKGLGSYPVKLTEAPAAGDVVSVEGLKVLDGNKVKIAGGNHTLKESDISGNTVSITLYPLTAGTGDVDLSVSFVRDGGVDGEVTVAELKLYRSLQDYKNGNDLGSNYGARYRMNDGLHETGMDFSGSSPEIIPIEYDNLDSGNYVVMIEFFRDDIDTGNLIKVSRLVQTIIVRGNLTTNTWDNSNSSVLAWNAFASSNANLAGTGGIKIGGNIITGYSPASQTYNLYEATTSVPASTTLTVTGGEPGQSIAVSLNSENTAPLVSGREYTLEGLGTGFPGLTNTLVITVTAPDGFTKNSYTVNMSGKEIIAFYFTIDERHYGVGPGDILLVNGSGSRGEETHITITVPYGTGISDLKPTIVHSGKSISPEAGEALGSSKNPHWYTVTPVAGEPRIYRVEVKAPNTAKKLTAFSITSPVSAEGVIDEDAKTVTVTVPYGTDVTAMTADVIVSPNASIRPDPEGGLNYTDSVTYTVTAEDGTTQEYTVTVKFYTINISGITVEGLKTLKISVSVDPSLLSEDGSALIVNKSAPITFTIDGGPVTHWYIDINRGAVTQTSATDNTVTFNAPAVPRFYNVNVFATVGDIDYSGSFGMIVE